MNNPNYSLNAKQAAISASTFYGAALGFFVGCFLMLSPVGPINAVIGPWATLLVATLLGAVIGYFAGPLFTGLFKSDGAFRDRHRWLHARNPLTGRGVRSATSNTHVVGG